MSKRGLNYSSKGLPPEKIVRLRELAAQGLTSREIAAALGTTKGTVMGRVHALGIQLMHKPGYAGGKKPKAAPKNNNPIGWSGVPKGVAAPPKPPMKPKDGNRYVPSLPVVRPVAAPVALMKLGHRSCRYIGERPELLTLDTPIYCGAPTVLDANGQGSWCPEHRARCIVKRTYA